MTATDVSPNFLFIGPDKTGSSWLFHLLSAHPEVFIPLAKDTYFFDRYYHFGMSWYLDLFRAATPEQICRGEICHDYLMSTDATDRIHTHLPECKLVTCLRHPAERSFSHWLYKRRAGETDASFEDAIEQFPEILQNSCYAENLSRYMDRFGKRQVLVLFFDDLQEEPRDFAKQVCEFLGLTWHESLPFRERQRAAGAARSPLIARTAKAGANLSRHMGMANLVGRVKHSKLSRLLYKEFDSTTKPRMSDATRQRLAEWFADDIDATELLTGRDLSRWRQ
ncbi:Sulfotransferase domain protein [Allorhodopirellula solitaria]|uniref:Sulfotransferase domain protein n=2 Tax=Allorhodopirellula solitaria TaxID=2527987 RepID=A0A5C5WPT0_9BACT|nr:Sulfotransferase domain protein [Allorhodopirellula solitaria]